MEKAVVDRIEEGMAVLLVGETEREVTVPIATLPHGATDGTWMWVEVDGHQLARAKIDAETTNQARARIREKLARLRRKGRTNL